MGINFEFSSSTRIVFGTGTFSKVPGFVQELGSKVLIVTGKSSILAEKLAAALKEKSVASKIINIYAEPTTSDIENGLETARVFGCSVVVGVGGGSAVDAAKAIAALAPENGDLTDYLEIIGKGKKPAQAPLPFIAIPTTAGTGAEVTKNAVIKSTQHRIKVSLRSDLMFPRIAVIDPQLTLSMPPAITAASGLDALTHLMETFVSCQSNPFIDILCMEGMKLIASSISDVYSDGQNLSAREKMAKASMLGGMALANVKLGAVHGFAGPLGGIFPVQHGAICACLLPAVMEVNLNALKEQNFKGNAGKYTEVARILTGKKNASAPEGIEYVKSLVKKFYIQRLSEFGITKSDFPELIEKARNSSSMQGNPVRLSDEQLHLILQKSV